MPDRRFPAPWSVDEENAACFIVRDRDGNSLAYVYFEDEPGRRFGRKPHDAGRGAAHCGEYSQAARAVEPTKNPGWFC